MVILIIFCTLVGWVGIGWLTALGFEKVFCKDAGINEIVSAQVGCVLFGPIALIIFLFSALMEGLFTLFTKRAKKKGYK